MSNFNAKINHLKYMEIIQSVPQALPRMEIKSTEKYPHVHEESEVESSLCCIAMKIKSRTHQTLFDKNQLEMEINLNA